MSCKTCNCRHKCRRGATGSIGATGATGASVPNVGAASSFSIVQSQSIPNEEITSLELNEEEWHNGVTVNPNSYTINQSGRYLIVANIAWTPNATGSRFITVAINNADTVLQTSAPSAGALLPTYTSVTGILDLQAGNIVEFKISQNSGSPLLIGLPTNVMIQLLH